VAIIGFQIVIFVRG